MISFVSINSLAWRLPWLMLHIDSSLIASGMQNVEWLVLPPWSNKDAMPLEATLSAIIPFALTTADKSFHKYVYPVPP